MAIEWLLREPQRPSPIRRRGQDPLARVGECSPLSAARRLLSLVAEQRARLVLAVGAMIVLALATGTYPILLDLLTTRLVAPADGIEDGIDDRAWAKGLDALARWGWSVDRARLSAFVSDNLLPIFMLVVVVKGLAQAVRFHAMGALAQHVTRGLRGKLFTRIVHQDAAFFGARPSGDLISRLMNDVRHVERTATYALPVMVGDVLRVLILGVVCLVEYTRLFVVALGVLPLAVLPIVYFGRLLKQYGRQAQEAVSDLTRRVTETLGGIRTVAVYGREKREIDRFEHAQNAYLDVSMRGVLVRALQTPAMEWVGVVAVVVTLRFALSSESNGGMRPGEVIGFLLALVLLYEPIKAIGRLSGIVMPGLASAERVFEIADQVSGVVSVPGARCLAGPAHEVALAHVGFRYREADAFTLEDISLTLRRGCTVALVGPSGGGKSTIASLVPRLFDVSKGVITVDGIDVRELELGSLREQVAMVEQEAYLFDDSVAENIAYGRASATREEIVAAAKRAHADAFIRALPAGYDARVGERGIQLSAGQRQRIAIARAFLRDAPILILDEVTSALDRESEEAIRHAVSGLVQDRVALVIAHRLSTVQQADEILVVDRGRIVERGRHDDLLLREGWYARWAAEGRGGGLRVSADCRGREVCSTGTMVVARRC